MFSFVGRLNIKINSQRKGSSHLYASKFTTLMLHLLWKSRRRIS
jgi:hypothetical protein